MSDPLTGFQRLVRARAHRLVVSRIPLTAGGTLAVRAVDRTYRRASPTTSASIKRLAARRNQFSKLGHCKLRKRKLTCTGGPAVKRRSGR